MSHISASDQDQRPKDPRVGRTRRALRNALLELLEECSFDRITVRDICARAHAGYATFFRHYTDKGALLDDLAAEAIRDLLGRSLPILYAVDTLAACHALCAFVDDNRRLWSVLLTGGAAPMLREEFLRQAQEAAAGHLAKAGASGSPGSWLPVDLAVLFGTSGVIEILAYWLQNPEGFNVAQMADVLDRLVIGPILRPQR